MEYFAEYKSPLGLMILSCDEIGLTGIRFAAEKYLPESETGAHLLENAKKWLDIYFSGRDPGFSLPIHLKGTDFQKEVWKVLLRIPYGTTVSYGEVAALLAKEKGNSGMLSRAVGNAVGHNKLLIIVPCHRVVGSRGQLTGYSAGIERKEWLLRSEMGNFRELFLK